MKPSLILQAAVVIVNYIDVSDCMLGDACKRNDSCSSSYSHDAYCKEGICSCNSQIELSYEKYSLEPKCDFIRMAKGSFSDECLVGVCSPKEECIELPRSYKTYYFNFSGRSMCKCKEGYIRIEDSCYPAVYQKPTEYCTFYEAGTTKSCDINEKTICKNGHCQCFENFFANLTSGKCEPMSDYVEAHNLTSYRVRPGEYCAKNEHCIDGLECRTYKCSCPNACPYKKEEQICDCGPAVSNTSLAGPILVGIIGGILIMAFWGKMIRKTIERHGKKKRHQFDALPTDNNEVAPNTNTYSLNHLDTHPVPNNTFGTSSSVPSAKIGENQSPPAVWEKPSPPPAVCLPQPSDNVSSTALAPSPWSPLLPTYDEQPSGEIIPPNFCKPPTTEPLPYSVNPTPLSYPSSSDALPYSINPTPLSYPTTFDAPLSEASCPSAPILNPGTSFVPSYPSAPMSYPSGPASLPYPSGHSAPPPYPSGPSAPPPYASGPSAPPPYHSGPTAPPSYSSSPSAPLPDPSGPAVPYHINPSDMPSSG